MIEPSNSPIRAGTLIGGRYQLTTPLGAGGMGWVFLATDTTLDGQEVALKFLYPHLLSDAVSFSRFRNEVLVARKLIHPNIVRTFNMGVDIGQAYIVMEYIDGQTLKAALQDEGVSGFECTRAIALALEICRGVCHSHALGIIHRDLKPDNVLVTADGQIKLSDFGLAATLRRQGNFTKVGQLLGTPYYMAPEQFRGEPPNERSDIYAFGILLYELLFGCVPFSDKSLYGLAMKHATERLIPPAETDKIIAPELWSIVQRAASKQPSERFSSCEELLRALEELPGAVAPASPERPASAIMRSTEGDAVTEPPPYDIRRTIRRASLPILFLTLIIAIPWIRTNLSAQSRVACFFLIIERHTGASLEPLYRIFGIDPGFRKTPLVHLGDSEIWPRIFVGDNPDAKENRAADDGRTILHVSTQLANHRMTAYLLKHGASAKTTTTDGRTPLHTAAASKDPKIVQLILDRGVDPNPRTDTLTTPLHLSVRQNDVATTSLLLANGADRFAKDKFGWSPLMYALSGGDISIINASLANLSAAQIPAEDLRLAAPTRNLEAIRSLFRDRFGSSPF